MAGARSTIAVCVRGHQPESGRHQRRVLLDVGHHDNDVAGLQGRVVGEQADDDLAKHLHLSSGAVAGMHLDARLPRHRVATASDRISRKRALQGS